MRVLLVTLLLAGTSARGARLVAQAPTPAATDSARLQGTWSMVSGAADGYPMPAAYVQSMRRVASGSEVTVEMGGRLFFKATISLEPTRSPKTIDYHMTGGPTVGTVQLGVYEISGDTARFCFASPGKARPKEFATNAGDGRTLSTWVRTAP